MRHHNVSLCRGRNILCVARWPFQFERWWARYHSKRIFGRFRWYAILVRPSDTMYDLETIVGCVPSPLALMRCHSDHFRLIQPILAFFDVFMLFSMFAYLYRTDYYIARLSMRFPYYSIPMRCISDPFRLFADFIYLHSYRYSDVLVIYSFCGSHYCYRFGLWSLRTISHIRSLRRYFDLSEVIFTYILPTTPILHRITSYLVPFDFVRLRIASIWLRLCSPAFLDLIPQTRPRHTAFYLVLLRSFDYTSF